MISLLPWILILIILGVIGFFMTQQYRDMQHALREMDLRLQEEALRTEDMEGQMQDLRDLLTEKWAELEEAMLHKDANVPVNSSLWKLSSIPEEVVADEDGSDVETLPVEDVVDDLLSKLETHVSQS